MIAYDLDLTDGPRVRFEVDPDRRPRTPTDADPEWIRLDYHRCPHCPLEAAQNCPAAADLQEIVDAFANVNSTALAVVRVETPERVFEKACDAQTGLGSLVGLVMATSGCPILAPMRPMAHTHLPFSTVEETITRTVSTWLLSQYLRSLRGETPDYELAGLRAVYTDLEALNTWFVERLRAGAERDANLNALVRLFTLSALVGMSVDRGLKLIAHWFEEAE